MEVKSESSSSSTTTTTTSSESSVADVSKDLLGNGLERTVKFEKAMREFFNICKTINESFQNKSLVVAQNFIYESFESFVFIYNKINDPLKTLPVFEEVYNSRNIKILSKNEEWISNQLIIEYPRVKKTKKKISIFVSIFYSKAKELSETAYKEIYEFNNDKNANDLHLIQKLKLSLLKIFILCCEDEKSKDMLQEYISELEAELPAVKTSGNTTKPPPNPADLLSNLGGMNISGLLNSFMGGMNQPQRGGGSNRGRGRGKGRKTRKGGKSSSSSANKKEGKEEDKTENKEDGEGEDVNIDEDFDKLQNLVGDVLQNPNVKNVAGTVIKKFKNADMSSMEGIGSVISDLFGDQQLRESLVGMIPQPVSEEEAEEMIEESKKLDKDHDDNGSDNEDGSEEGSNSDSGNESEDKDEVDD